MRTIKEAIAQREAEGKPTKLETAEPKQEGKPVDQNSAQTNEPEEKSQLSEDIVERVAKAANKPVESEGQASEAPDTKFNLDDINKIEDPQAREYAEKAYKSLLGDYTKKTQDLAAERKEIEKLKQDFSTWTPEKVQSLLSNEEFINASQAVVQSSNPTDGELSDEQWSALSDTEKAEIKQMKQELESMKRQNQMSKLQAELDRQNTELSNKYANYNADRVYQLRNDMIQGKIQATNEHLWKVINYEDAIKRAYEMGKEDRNLDTTAKREASSAVGMSGSTSRNEGIAKEENESSLEFLKRSMRERLKQKTQKT